MIAVIGDIHGCYYTLLELIKAIESKYPGIKIYCVGDLVDRGNFSYEVLEYIEANSIQFTPGNHDFMFYYFLTNPDERLAQAWLYNGYEATIRSFKKRYHKMADFLELIEKAPFFFNLKDCFISHAGVSVVYKKNFSGNPLDSEAKLDYLVQQDLKEEYGILWTRDELMDLGKLQIVGHTRKQNVDFRKSNNVVYIDTSVYTGNKLSAVIVENNRVLQVISVPTKPVDIE